MTTVGEILELSYGKALTASDRDGGDVPVVGSGGVVGGHSKGLTDAPTIVVGRKGSIGSVTWIDGSAWPIDTAYFVKAKREDLDRRWMYWMLRSLGMETMNKSAAVPGLNRDDVYRLEVDLPPFQEQRRIAAILDHADALRAKRRQVLAHLDSLTQAIFHDMFGDRGRPTTTLGELATFYSGGTPSKSRPEFWDGQLPWFSPKDLKRRDLTDAQDHISEKVPTETNLRLLPPDSVALVVRGMILAHTLPISVLRVTSTINQDLKAVLPRKDLDVDFLAASLRAKSQWLLARVATAAHGTKRLETAVLEATPIPVADRSTQLQFSERVIKSRHQHALAERAVAADDELFASLQSRAFRGEL